MSFKKGQIIRNKKNGEIAKITSIPIRCHPNSPFCEYDFIYLTGSETRTTGTWHGAEPMINKDYEPVDRLTELLWKKGDN